MTDHDSGYQTPLTSVEAYKRHLLAEMDRIAPPRDSATWHIHQQVRARMLRWHVKAHWLAPEAQFSVTRTNGDVNDRCSLQDVETILTEDPGATYVLI